MPDKRVGVTEYQVWQIHLPAGSPPPDAGQLPMGSGAWLQYATMVDEDAGGGVMLTYTNRSRNDAEPKT